jgi:hypothetical protein
VPPSCYDHTYANGNTKAELTAPDLLAGLKALARQVAPAGIRHVLGDVLIDDRFFDRSRGSGSGPRVLTPIVVNGNSPQKPEVRTFNRKNLLFPSLSPLAMLLRPNPQPGKFASPASRDSENSFEATHLTLPSLQTILRKREFNFQINPVTGAQLVRNDPEATDLAPAALPAKRADAVTGDLGHGQFRQSSTVAARAASALDRAGVF